jgi:hypothetical protein
VFGALAAAPFSDAAGYGVALPKLTLGLFVFPAVLNWFLDWSVRRREFFTKTETGLLYHVKEALRNPTGWVRQNPQLAKSLRPIDGLVSAKEIAAARRDWPAACDKPAGFIGELVWFARAANPVNRIAGKMGLLGLVLGGVSFAIAIVPFFTTTNCPLGH